MSYINLQGLRKDGFAGVTAAVVALPLALAFGIQSELGAMAGLYGAIILGFFAAVFGGTKLQISGPTGPITVVVAGFVAQTFHTFGTGAPALAIIVFTFILVGLFQIILGLLRAGDFICYIPYPVISGFMTGIGLIVIALQIFPALGHHSPTAVREVFFTLHEPLQAVNTQALMLTLATIIIIYVFPKLTKLVPSSLVALVVMSFVSYFLHLKVPMIGDIPKGLPSLQTSFFSVISFQTLTYVIVPAITIAIIGAIDSLLTSVVADNLSKTSHNSNRELIGQGIGNALCGLFGAMPGAGATMRTVVNIRSGAQGRLAGVIHSIVLIAILLKLGPYAAQIPLAVLAGILITVGISIIDYKGFVDIVHIPRADAGVMLLVVFLTVFVNLLDAVAVGIVVASVLFMKKMSDVSTQSSKVAPILQAHDEVPWDDEIAIPSVLHDKVYFKHLHGPLFFGFTSQFHDMAKKIPNIKVVIIRLKLVPFIDQSGLYALVDVYQYLTQRNIKVIFTGVQQQPRDMLHDLKVVPEKIPEDAFFTEFSEAIHSLERFFQEDKTVSAAK